MMTNRDVSLMLYSRTKKSLEVLVRELDGIVSFPSEEINETDKTEKDTVSRLIDRIGISKGEVSLFGTLEENLLCAFGMYTGKNFLVNHDLFRWMTINDFLLFPKKNPTSLDLVKAFYCDGDSDVFADFIKTVREKKS